MIDQLLFLLNHAPVLSTCLLFVFGLLFGSFFNVVIYRLPKMLEAQWQAEIAWHQGKEAEPARFNLAWPNSHCPSCQHALTWWQNIPLVSYLLLRGKCGFCKKSIPGKYPLTELATGVVWAGLTYLYGVNMNLLAALILASLLIILFVIDLETQLLPDLITLPGIWIGLLFNIRPVFCMLHIAVYGAVAGYMTLWIIGKLFTWLRKKQGMGHGDMKMLAMLGAWLGLFQLYYCLLLAVFVGLIMAGYFLIRKKMGKDTPMPFGPALALAGLVFLFIQPVLPSPFLVLLQ